MHDMRRRTSFPSSVPCDYLTWSLLTATSSDSFPFETIPPSSRIQAPFIHRYRISGPESPVGSFSLYVSVRLLGSGSTITATAKVYHTGSSPLPVLSMPMLPATMVGLSRCPLSFYRHGNGAISSRQCALHFIVQRPIRDASGGKMIPLQSVLATPRCFY
ncbi:hypothetical protein M501DRAFT_626682 [Patellaria atrata CBS 101060]|uniref:Uncharacterized protein n=1 Tax=Patellaria atrata CBS 101060 TaxID=1346257 RepID=A0A9P4VT94_9PEZI|nr:hypothetical protein M501DRAFT_626682 [Patellaria atrata CBS 101060]